MAGPQVAVLVPVAQLDKAHARLDEPPGQQALAPEIGCLLIVDCLKFLDRCRLVGLPSRSQ